MRCSISSLKWWDCCGSSAPSEINGGEICLMIVPVHGNIESSDYNKATNIGHQTAHHNTLRMSAN